MLVPNGWEWAPTCHAPPMKVKNAFGSGCPNGLLLLDPKYVDCL